MNAKAIQKIRPISGVSIPGKFIDSIMRFQLYIINIFGGEGGI